jgi:SAM-dependent MidA family methyltransferase
VVANEFFDALPVRQLLAGEHGWHERLVSFVGGKFVPAAGPLLGDSFIPGHVRAAPPGTILETSPAACAIMQDLARRVAAQGGAALIIDYGHVRTSAGETLQAVRGHRFADPWTAPGEKDLTAHVDFEALGDAARVSGVRVYGPVEQGDWLRALGIDLRAAALANSAPERRDEIEEARLRLTDPEQMGKMFKIMALVADGLAQPAGF